MPSPAWLGSACNSPGAAPAYARAAPALPAKEGNQNKQEQLGKLMLQPPSQKEYRVDFASDSAVLITLHNVPER